MNQKRDDIEQFLDRDLLPQVKTAFSVFGSGAKADLQEELAKMKAEIERLGYVAEDNPKYVAKKTELDAAVDVSALENEVFSQLTNFFRRYYNGGDFLSLRRYKAGVYAIPYEGEEVKLHWANADQYYIKSSENFRDYTFKLPSGKRAHFKLVDASTEQNNKKEQAGKERRFIILEDSPLLEDNGELYIRFEYRVTEESSKQTALNGAAVQTVLAAASDDWKRELSALSPTEKNTKRTLLEKHLNDYTAKYSFDYFIHKDLGGFMRRELDFFIKNEVLFIDDLDTDHVRVSISKVKVIKEIGHKVIAFLEQLENFQKKLWLKKKFVVETGYCVTLDKVPSELYPTIITNTAQVEEWKRLFAIQDIEGDLLIPKYCEPLTEEFLKANPFLVIDTAFFDRDFTEKLIATFDNLEETINGVLVHGENFQALNLMLGQLQEQVKCIYIDPPYNTASSSIPYKNDYKHSSFASMMKDRIALLHRFLRKDGAMFVSIDKAERTVVEHMMDFVFSSNNRVEELIWSMNTNNSQAPNYSTNHEYVQVYAKDKPTAEQDKCMFREPKPGYEEVMALVSHLNPTFPTIAVIEEEIHKLYEIHKNEYREEVEAQGLEWDDEKGNDLWKGLFNYNGAEYRDKQGNLISELDAKEKKAQIWIWRESDASMPATKQAASTRNPDDKNWRYYNPAHPITGKPCPHPKSGWKFAYDDDEDSPDKRSFVALERDNRIVWGKDEIKVPQLKRMLHEVETNVGKSVFTDYSDGEKQTSALFGTSGVFLAPKHADFVSRFIRHVAKKDSTILDCFGGSGSTAHAVINQNREDKGSRKYVLVEVGEYFNTIIKPRIQKVIYSRDWRSGKPVSREGSSHLFKYIRLESYEDALNNLKLKAQTGVQQSLLVEHDQLREQYMLSYMLDVESAGSASLLNISAFADPFGYRMNIARGNETKETVVDLVETFNWLLGIKVLRISQKEYRTADFESDAEGRLQIKGRPRTCDRPKLPPLQGEGWGGDGADGGFIASHNNQPHPPPNLPLERGGTKSSNSVWTFQEVEGKTLSGDKVLVIWRTLTDNPEQDNLMLDTWFGKRNYSTLDFEFARIYVNGDNNLENLKIGEERWKVALIEAEFKKLMFDVEGV